MVASLLYAFAEKVVLCCGNFDAVKNLIILTKKKQKQRFRHCWLDCPAVITMNDR